MALPTLSLRYKLLPEHGHTKENCVKLNRHITCFRGFSLGIALSTLTLITQIAFAESLNSSVLDEIISNTSLPHINYSPESISPMQTAENLKLYNWYSKASNYEKVYDSVSTWYPPIRKQGCVAFMSTALRYIGIPVPHRQTKWGNLSLLTLPFSDYLIDELDWRVLKNFSSFQPGDILFTVSDESSMPTHTLMFHGWVDQEAGIATVIDNQSFIHERNLYGSVKPDYDAIWYGLRSP